MSKHYPFPSKRSDPEEDEKMYGKRDYTTNQKITALLKKPRTKRSKKTRGK